VACCKGHFFVVLTDCDDVFFPVSAQAHQKLTIKGQACNRARLEPGELARGDGDPAFLPTAPAAPNLPKPPAKARRLTLAP
jgi:hypothetical protein